MKRKNRCGECDSCLAANCGSCPHCRDMIKFGGPGKMKQACVNRVCVTRSLGEAGGKSKRAQDTKGRKRNDRTNYSRGSHGCDQCERQFNHKNDLEAHLLTHSIQNPLKCTGDANSQEEKVKIEKNEKNECNNSEGEIEIIGEMCSNHNLMAQSEKMSINNNDLGVTNKSKLEDKLGTDNENCPLVSILPEKAEVRISEKKFYKTEGISLSDVEMHPRGMKSDSAVQMIDTGVGFNEVKNSVISQRADEKKSEDIIKKNKTRVQFDEVIVISDEDTDLTSLDRQYKIKSSENYSGRIDKYFKKDEVLKKTVEGLKDEDDKADSEVNANKGGNSSQLIGTHEPHEKNMKGYLMSENSLEISNAAKISQQSLNEEQTNCNGSSKTSVITKKPSFETTEKKVTSANIGKDDIINSENIIRKNKTSIESTGITVFEVDEDMDMSDQLKEECCESYFSPIRTNYSKDVKEIAAQELVQDEMAQLEKVLTIKKHDNAVLPIKRSTNNENISNKSILEVNVNLRIPAATFLNSPEKHCEGELRKNKIIETDNGYMSEEIGEMSEFSTTSDEDDSSDQSEELIDKSVEEHFDRHSNLNLSVPIPSFNHPLLSFSRSQAGSTPSTKLSHTAGNVMEDTQTRCPRFQDYWDNEFEDMTTSDFFESLPIEDRSIEDVYEDFIKRKSIYIN